MKVGSSLGSAFGPRIGLGLLAHQHNLLALALELPALLVYRHALLLPAL
jgi:hypothetical protein